MTAVAMAVPMELELPSADDLDDFGETDDCLEDAKAAAVLESPDAELLGDSETIGAEEMPMLAGATGQAGETVQASQEGGTEAAETPVKPAALPSSAHDFASDLEDAVRGVETAQSSYDDAKSLYRAARKDLEKAQSRLLAIAAKGTRALPLFDGMPKPASGGSGGNERMPAKATSLADSPGATATTFTPPNQSPDAWRHVPIAVLVDCGLSQAVVDLLVERGVETMGQLEDARADAYNGGLKQFKGVGQGKADKIEDASINWLTRNRDAQVLAEVQTEDRVAELAGATPTDADAHALAEPVASELPGNGHPGVPENAENLPESIEVRAKQLNTGKKNCLAPHLPDEGCWNDGSSAFDRGDAIHDCSWLPGPNRDDWLRGWMAAELLSHED